LQGHNDSRVTILAIGSFAFFFTFHRRHDAGVFTSHITENTI